MDSRQVLWRLRTDRWEEVARRDNHVQMTHPTKPGRITVPHPKLDLPASSLAGIERLVGIRVS